MFGTQSFKTLAVAGFLAVMAGAVQAVTISFDRITSNSSADSAGQLHLEVTDDGTRALFTFSVSGTAPAPDASISEIYFSDLGGLFTPPPRIVQQTGVAFVAGSANPGDLPGGNLASSPFVVTTDLLADATGRNTNSIQFGDLLVLGLNYASGFDFSDLLAGFDSGDFRVGLHVRSLVGGDSDSFVNVSPVPLPAAGFLLIGALGGLAALRRRRTLA
jgi:hypothetical protein